MVDSLWHKFTVPNKQGLSLSALLYDGDYRKNFRINESRADTVIVVSHGFTGSKEGSGRAITMAEELSGLGFSTLLFDFSGCGESEGSWEDISLSGQTTDLGAIVDWCREKGFKRIVLTGRSFGGTTVLNYAARDEGINAVCTWAAVARPGALFEKRIGKTYLKKSQELVAIKGEEGVRYLKRKFFDDLRKHDLQQSSAALSPRSFLIIHGSADQSVPVEEAELLYKAAKEPKKLVIIEGADHRFTDHLEQVWNNFFDWLKKL